jgi:hypothetical protein
MSRIRTVKPDFWVSEQVLSCSPLTRLLFIGMWNFCDDNGVHPASYVRLRAEIFPGDNYALDDIKHWIGELISSGLVREYVVENITYWIVTGWKKHQRIDRPTYKHPLPLSDIKKITDNSSNTHRVIIDDSATTPQVVSDGSATDRNGMERRGKEKDICEVETSHVCAPDYKPLTSTQEVFTHWQQVMNHPHAKLDTKRRKVIMQALGLGYTADNLKLAIDGCSKTPFNAGQNDRGQRYDSINLIFRDADHIDQFIANATNPPRSTNPNVSTTDPMAGAL